MGLSNESAEGLNPMRKSSSSRLGKWVKGPAAAQAGALRQVTTREPMPARGEFPDEKRPGSKLPGDG